MVDFKTFEKILNDIKKWSDTIDEMHDRYKINLIESPLGCCTIVDHLVNTLEAYMKDNFNYISWWCWETDFGQKNAEIYMCGAEGEEEVVHKIDTIEKLYDLVTEGEIHG